jgi:threonine dehydrogenase-like Zn-dependent dehydrogenase
MTPPQSPTMRALVFDGAAKVVDIPRPIPAPDELLIRVRRAGVCSTDLEITRGYMRFHGVLGHEFVGDVVEGPPEWKGRRVASEINCVCGRCDMCAGGLANHCRDRTVIGILGRPGAFAEYVAVPRQNCHQVPDAVDDEAAVFIEPLAAAFQITRQVNIESRYRVAVLGTGRLGLLVAMVLKRTGCRLVAIGRNPGTIALLDRKHIATTNVDDADGVGRHDVVIDCTGSPDGLPLALRLVRPRGVIVMKTTCQASQPLNLAPLVIDEVSLIGSRCGPFPDAIAALARRDIDPAPLITARLPLSRGDDALRTAAQRDQIKVLIDPTT